MNNEEITSNLFMDLWNDVSMGTLGIYSKYLGFSTLWKQLCTHSETILLQNWSKQNKMAPIWPQRVPQVPQEPPKWTATSPQELPKVLKKTKMDAQGTSRTANGAEITTQGTSTSEHDAKMIPEWTSEPQNDTKMVAQGTSRPQNRVKTTKIINKNYKITGERPHIQVILNRPSIRS